MRAALSHAVRDLKRKHKYPTEFTVRRLGRESTPRDLAWGSDRSDRALGRLCLFRALCMPGAGCRPRNPPSLKIPPVRVYGAYSLVIVAPYGKAFAPLPE